MALTSFDGTFSFKQEELARMGGHEPSQMNAAQWEEFQNSPFMKNMRKAEAICIEKTATRDEERGKRDIEFDPKDSDWNAPKAFDYDKGANYYRMLGVDDLASLNQIKEAYKKLSLIYHPDKTAGMTAKEKEEHNSIFIELKNAYKTLSDQPTRRQYDRDRDSTAAVMEVNGWKPKVKRGFDATEVLKKLQEEQKNPGKTIEIEMSCRLEKFFWGGHKSHKRERKLKDFVGFTVEEKTFRLDVPRGAPHPMVLEFKHAGDHQEDARPDTLRFIMSAKPHEAIDREGDDLVVRKSVAMRPDAHMQPYLSGQVDSVRGNRLVFWGRNPLFRTTGSGGGTVAFKVVGQGCGWGSLRFNVKLGASADTEDKVVIRLKQLNTGGEMAMRLPKTAKIGDVQDRARSLLDFLGSQNVKIMRAAGGGHQPYPEDQPVGSQRSFDCGGTPWSEVPMPYESALVFLYSVVGILETEAFQASLAEGYRMISRSKTDAQKHVNDLWLKVCEVLPDYGFDQSIEMMKVAVEKALDEIENDRDNALLVAKAKKMIIGFNQNKYYSQDEESSKPKPRGLSNHALMLAKTQARLSYEPRCELELWPLLPEPITMYTQPTCQMMLHSNAGQAATPAEGLLKPRLMYAASLSCQVGAKKSGAEEWKTLAENLAPVVEASLCCLLRSARGILPKPLLPKPYFPEDAYKLDPDVIIAENGKELPEEEVDEAELDVQDTEEEEEEGKDDDDDDDDDDDCGGGMFDFGDMEDAAEKKKKQAEAAERREKRREAKRAIVRQLKQETKALAKRAAAAEAKGTNFDEETPWGTLGDEAARRGDNFLAAKYYSRQLERLKDTGSDAERATVLASRSSCYAKVEHFDAAFEDAKEAVSLRDRWGGAWGALGFAAAKRGPDYASEACSAYFKAVQYDTLGQNVDALFEITKQSQERSTEKAEEEKALGNEAMKVPDEGLAIAHYTCAIAKVPDIESEEDPNIFLIALLFSNRSLAFARIKGWDAAVADGHAAVATCPVHPKAYFRLGTALLGVGQNEQAYAAFANGLKLNEEDEQLKNGRQTCLTLMPLWRSVPAMQRLRTRFSMDLKRPKASSKVYVMSDLHYDHKKNDEWVHHIDEFMFQEDVLIVAGNVADTLKSLMRALRALKMKFRRVFFTPGNHEMWIHPSEVKLYPDSIAKFNAIMEACDELGVDVFPAPIAEDCYIVPLFSWYNSEYDEGDPFPDPKLSFDMHCRFPLHAEQEVWKFFLDLNKFHLQLPYDGTVMSFSHFLPRHGLPFDKAVPKIAKVMGCEELDEQVRAASLKSRLHVYGHARKKHAKLDEGVMYISHPLGYENEHTDKEPLMLVYNGQSVCNRTMPIDKS